MENIIIGPKNVVLNFSSNFCLTEQEILASESFKKVFESYYKKVNRSGKDNVINLFNICGDPIQDFIDLFKLLISFEVNEIKKINEMYNKILTNNDDVYEMVEDFYEHWRRLERYSITYSYSVKQSMLNVNFINSIANFTTLVLGTYRTIAQKVYGKKFHVYRQLPSGVNAAMLLSTNDWVGNMNYDNLRKLSFIDSVIIRPPFTVYSDKNTRSGLFQEVFENPITNLEFNTDEWLCFPAYVGDSLAYVYFHKDYMSLGITISNLFEFVPKEECLGVKPNLIYVFGAPTQGKCVYYHDKENDIYIGLAPYGTEIEYFGYMKKMLLTLHNVRMIKSGYLPIHGACVNVVFKSGINKTLVIIGDSGAGKSESLEALRTYAEEDIVSMTTIFDDMGTFKFVNDKVYAYGTEIGAFVRLDDLENGYAYEEMDRAIFMNPDKINARVVMPVCTYRQIMRGFEVDLVLYANNYDKDHTIKFYDKYDDVIDIFREGARFAKGTTSEVGLVKSYFANPFGCVQMKEECDILLQNYFKKLYETNVRVGQLYTKLAVPDMASSGPKEASEKLFEVLRK